MAIVRSGAGIHERATLRDGEERKLAHCCFFCKEGFTIGAAAAERESGVKSSSGGGRMEQQALQFIVEE